MRKTVIVLAMLVAAIALGAAERGGFSKAAKNPELIQEGEAKMWCAVCGMNLKKFYKTSHAVILDDGSKRQYCSIRCLAAQWPKIGKHVKKILAADAATDKLIDAQKAYYVVGSSVKGTMSQRSKIAFASLEDAKKFVSEYGGEIVDFKTAFAMAKEDLKKDMAMMKQKKRMMYKKGEAIYNRMCKEQIDKKRFKNIAQLKSYIKKSGVCGDLKGKRLQALVLYIWEAKDKNIKEAQKISVPKNAKCPVCGMFVHKYPRWAAVAVSKSGERLYFDGVKDMFRFMFDSKRYGYGNFNTSKLVVTDYYTQKPIDAKKAYYVIGSDVLGPMGEELIPFATLKEAQSFKKDHKGKRVLRFEEVDKEVIAALE